MSQAFLSTIQTFLNGRISRVLFCAVWFGLLVSFLFSLGDNYQFEQFVVFLLILVLVGFPASIVGLTSLMIAGWFFDPPAIPVGWMLLITWIAFFMLGYLQWFVVLPALITRYRTRQKNVR